MFAIAEAMRPEYEAIAAAGAPCSSTAPTWRWAVTSAYADLELDEFRAAIAVNVEALNHAVRNIPAEQLRMHLCWGNYPGRTTATCRWPTSSTSSGRPSRRRCSSRPPTPATPTSGRSSTTTDVPDDKILCPA